MIRIWRYIFWLYILLIAVDASVIEADASRFMISLLPQVSPPSVYYIDKGLHLFAFLGLAVLALLGEVQRGKVWLLVIALIALAAAIEVGQWLAPGMAGSFADFAAGFAGVIGGIALGVFLRPRSRRAHTERRLVDIV